MRLWSAYAEVVTGSDSPHLPASPFRRILAGLINVAVVGGVLVVLSVVVRVPLWVGLATCAVLVALMITCQAMTGAGPGGALTGIRLRRITRRDAAPGRVTVLRAGLIGVAAVATLGVGPLVMVARAGGQAWRQAWFDRVVGTTVVARGKPSVYVVTLGDRVVPMAEPTVLGRAPERVEGMGQVSLVAVLKEEPSVSKTHVLLEPTAQGVLVTDLGSTNGTYVEGPDGVRRLRPGLSETVERDRKVYLGEAMCLIR